MQRAARWRRSINLAFYLSFVGIVTLHQIVVVNSDFIPSFLSLKTFFEFICTCIRN